MTNYIKRFYDQEIWKQVELKSPFAEKYELHVSNHGNIKKINILKGTNYNITQTLTQGYPSVHFTTILPIQEKDQAYFTIIRNSMKFLKLDIASMTEAINLAEKPDTTLAQKIIETQELLKTINTNYIKNYKKREQKRKRNFSALIHRLVAIYFLEPAPEDKNLVGHIDYDKLNNHHSNLKWMTREESSLHQRSSPFVIKAKEKVLINGGHRGNTKLDEKQVMILKKRINEGIPLRELAKRTKVTETQLLRIKRGINWGKVPAAL
ncbi:HNH endonuclease [Flavobacterium psychrophilum]|uniref:HNH endonuclease n=1 Tax=Flavobacterium psychrophilum TaxID=96345 RepID=UPI003984793C